MDWLDLRNSILCAESVCLAAVNRKESRGAHQMEDIPETRPDFDKNQVIEFVDGCLISNWEDVIKHTYNLERKIELQ